jgi:lysophospholipase L1-like esterase
LAIAREKVQRASRAARPLPSEITERVFRDAAARCRANGVAIAFFWTPTSPAYRSWQTAEDRAQLAAYHRQLEAELGAWVFPAPPDDLLAEEDFADGYHLLHRGAERYSRWLADAHLNPWLAGLGVTR